MRSFLLSALLFLTPAALAGGAGAPAPAPRAVTSPVTPAVLPAAPTRTLPASAPVQPGQTWVLRTSSAAGETAERLFVLKSTPPTWDEGWTFLVDGGEFAYIPEDGMLYLLDASSYDQDETLRVCFALLTGGAAQGFLFAGTPDEIDEEIEASEFDPGAYTTGAELAAAARAAGLGTCTVTRR